MLPGAGRRPAAKGAGGRARPTCSSMLRTRTSALPGVGVASLSGCRRKHGFRTPYFPRIATGVLECGSHAAACGPEACRRSAGGKTVARVGERREGPALALGEGIGVRVGAGSGGACEKLAALVALATAGALPCAPTMCAPTRCGENGADGSDGGRQASSWCGFGVVVAGCTGRS
ncbi:hypothetical protein HRbin30_03163 [bacterium HR30]|nr:hypothetical protein HRbin30_03163 [bacterium HR30]